ncbi:MAG: Crp/Fnr family transcriptional regulator [Dehalobacter sp. 4CP]|uniref:Crp/Fnr family transcriptional regulator n=1 Tax=Dehalobacter sp. CP TaxID=2594474 RepID=UPI0013CB4336|nr:Crp/Fnr family transcriptional regulator [Dehalobacter sp. 4CP]
MKDKYFPILSNDKINIKEYFEEMGDLRIFKKGDILSHPEAPIDGINYIVRGNVDAYLMSSDGRKKSVGIEMPGCILGDVGAFDGEFQPVYYKALTQIETRFISKSDLKTVLDNYPCIKDYVLSSLCSKVRMLAGQLGQSCFSDAETKVSKLLLQFAYYFGGNNNHNGLRLICFPISQQSISDLAGINRVTVAKILANFKEDGLIERVEGMYSINIDEMEKLVALLELS